MEPFLQMRGISKTFPGVKALQQVDLDVFQGEVVALAGENGAGKSTLMKIMTGVYTPDPGGSISVEGSRINIRDPIHARQLGISIIYQELSTAGNMTVAENIFLAKEPRNKLGFLQVGKMNQEAKRLLKRLNVDIDPRTQVGELSIGQQQMIEIAKAISYDCKIVVMDEPTASLSHYETRTLMELVKQLRRDGIGIIYISHRLEEIFELADRVTILRDGRTVGTLPRAEATPELLVKKMVDRELSEIYAKDASYVRDEVVLDVRAVGYAKPRNSQQEKIRDITFKLRKGEILGFAGLVGSGRTEIMELLFGMYPVKGQIMLDGEEVRLRTPRQAIDKGIGFVTEDRKQKGLVLDMSVRENFSLTHLRQYCNMQFVNRTAENRNCGQYVQSLGIRTPSPEQPVVNLSGGNQQKVVIAKWVACFPKVLIVDEPTRGIDIAAKAEVHSLLCRLAQQGIGIIMISSDLPEVLAMSDRMLVVHEGQIMGEFERGEATQEKVMEAATGQNRKAQAAV